MKVLTTEDKVVEIDESASDQCPDLQLCKWDESEGEWVLDQDTIDGLTAKRMIKLYTTKIAVDRILAEKPDLSANVKKWLHIYAGSYEAVIADTITKYNTLKEAVEVCPHSIKEADILPKAKQYLATHRRGVGIDEATQTVDRIKKNKKGNNKKTPKAK